MTEKLKQLNASWILDLLVKILVVAILPWGIWITKTVIVFQATGERFTKTDGFQLRLQMIEMEQRLDARMDNLPPKDFRDRMTTNEEQIRKLRDELVLFEREFSANFVRKDELNR